jgi:hypothetical protein
MAEIGKKGFASVVSRYFGGDAPAANGWLHLQATERKIDRLVSEKLESGEETCVEMPVIFRPGRRSDVSGAAELATAGQCIAAGG